jgi:hypothetical protein
MTKQINTEQWRDGSWVILLEMTVELKTNQQTCEEKKKSKIENT